MKTHTDVIARNTITGEYFVKGSGFITADINEASVLNQIEASLAKFTWENVEFITR